MGIKRTLGWMMQLAGIAIIAVFDGYYDALGVVLMFMGYNLELEYNLIKMQENIFDAIDRLNETIEYVKDKIDK